MQDPIDVQDLEHDSVETETEPARDQLEAHLRDSIVRQVYQELQQALAHSQPSIRGHTTAG